MVIEDDCTFLPYSKDLINKIETESGDFEFGIINLSPTLNRPVNRSEEQPLFLDITNLPPKKEHERGIFATNMMIYHSSIYDKVLEMEKPEKLGYYAIRRLHLPICFTFKTKLLSNTSNCTSNE